MKVFSKMDIFHCTGGGQPVKRKLTVLFVECKIKGFLQMAFRWLNDLEGGLAGRA